MCAVLAMLQPSPSEATHLCTSHNTRHAASQKVRHARTCACTHMPENFSGCDNKRTFTAKSRYEGMPVKRSTVRRQKRSRARLNLVLESCGTKNETTKRMAAMRRPSAWRQRDDQAHGGNETTKRMAAMRRPSAWRQSVTPAHQEKRLLQHLENTRPKSTQLQDRRTQTASQQPPWLKRVHIKQHAHFMHIR